MVNHSHVEKDGIELFGHMPILRLPSLPVPMSPTGQSRLAIPTGASFAFLDQFKPDIIHTHSPYGAGFEALRAAKRYNVPLIGTNHTPVEEFYPFAPESMRSYDAWYYNHCAYITAPYQALIDRMREKGFTKPGKALPNPVELTHFTPPTPEEKQEAKAVLNIPGEAILYCGRLAPEKRVDVALRGFREIAADFPTTTFVITGHGTARASLEALAKELGIAHQVRFTGFLTTGELITHYRASDIFTLLSTSDSQSVALMQAFASGIPAVGARARGLPDYIKPECGFLVAPGDYKACGAYLAKLLSDKELRTRMGVAGALFTQTLSPAHIASLWEEVYRGAQERP